MSTKIQRPDRNQFDKEFNELKEKLSGLQAQQKKAQEELRAAPGAKNDPEWQKLLDELNEAKKQRDEARGSVQGTQNEVRTLDGELQKKIREITALRPKQGPKSDEEFARAIASIEKQVDSGELKLVDEKKALKEIVYLRNGRKSVSGIPKLEAEASEIKAKIAALRKTVDDSALKKANTSVVEINKKLDARKSARSDAAKAKSAVWERKRGLEEEIKATRGQLDTCRETFNAKMSEWRDATAEERQRKADEEKLAKDQAQKAKKISEAEEKVEVAKEPAFASQIAQAQSLLSFFAPWNPNATNGHAQQQTESAASKEPSLQKQKVAAPLSRKELKRKANNSNKPQALRLDVGVIEGLSALNIDIPRNPEDASEISKKLEDKIEFYNTNNDRVTKEKVERAEEALAKLKAELE